MYLNSDPMDRIGHKRHYKQNDQYQVKMPGGENFFIDGNRQAFPHKINQHQHRSEIYDSKALEQNEKFDNTYQQRNFDRSLDIHDIEGTKPGTLISKVVKNKDLAQNYPQRYHNQQQKQQNSDALDNFLRESQGAFKDRKHYFEENNQGNQQQRYQSSIDTYNNQGQQLQRQDKQQDTDRYRQTKELEERIRYLQMEEDKLRQDRQRQQQKQDDDDYYYKQKYLEQMKREQDEEERQQNLQEDSIQQEKMRRLQELENEISGLKQNEKQFRYRNEPETYSQNKQNEQQYQDSYKIAENKYQQQQKKVQISENPLDIQRQKASENLEKLNQLKIEKEQAYRQNQSSIYDNILSQQKDQANFKIDINGYPVYRQAKNYQRQNPTSLSYGSKNDYNNQKQMSYGILDNRIREQSNVHNYNQQSERYQNKSELYNPNLPLYKQERDQSLRDFRNQQEIEQQQNKQYKEKLEMLKKIEQNRTIDQYQKQGPPQNPKIDPSIQYASEYKQTYKPEFEKSRPLGPFDNKYLQGRQVPPHYYHSKLNALGSIPNEPRDTVEIAKEIIKPPSAERAEKRAYSSQNELGNDGSLRNSQAFYGTQDRVSKDKEEKEYMEKLKEYQKFDRENNHSISKIQTNYDMGVQRQNYNQYQKNFDGSQLMDKTNFGQAAKNVSKIKIY